MPEVGEIKPGRELNKPHYARNYKFIWQPCDDCGLAKWIRFKKGKPEFTICLQCSRQRPEFRRKQSEASFNGGRSITESGYIRVYLNDDDFFWPMVPCKHLGKHYVLEHRLVVAKALGRCLQPWEIVHHKGIKFPLGSIENKQDNRYPENLELTGSLGEHSLDHSKGYADGYEKGLRDGHNAKIKQLEKRIKELETS